MSDYPRFEAYRKAKPSFGEDRDFRLSDWDGDPDDVPFRTNGATPYRRPAKYDFDTLEEAMEVVRRKANAADLLLTDYYVLKVTEDDVEVAHGEPTKTAGGGER